MRRNLIQILILLQMLNWTASSLSMASQEPLSPAAVGWGNLLVPGLGATLRGLPERGLFEASSEIGLFYGGTFGVKEGAFTIDGSVNVPTAGNLYRPLLGQIMQEAGLKLHMFDTFYNYQQAAIAVENSEREKKNPQPLYRGSASDIMAAPFKWDNLSSAWVYPLVLVSSVFLVIDYHNTPLKKLNFNATPGEETLYGFSQIGAIPLGSAFGEEPLFRGFIMRETRLYTNSVTLSILLESTLFTLIHPNELKATAFLSGIYFGLMTNYYAGNIEKATAAHFWVNVVDGVTTYFLFRRVQGKDTPFSPPITAQFQIPF